jgi:hypothetical protein
MISRATEDFLTTLIMQRLAEAGFWKAFIESTDPDDVDAVQAAIDRHGARMHAAGDPGWTVHHPEDCDCGDDCQPWDEVEGDPGWTVR